MVFDGCFKHRNGFKHKGVKLNTPDHLKILPRFSFHSAICGHQKMTPKIISSPSFRNIRPKSLVGRPPMTPTAAPSEDCNLYDFRILGPFSCFGVFSVPWGPPHAGGCLSCLQPGRPGRDPPSLGYPETIQHTSFLCLLGRGGSSM